MKEGERILKIPKETFNGSLYPMTQGDFTAR